MDGSLIEWLKQVAGWATDPAQLIQWSMSLVGWLFGAIGNLMPGTIGDQFENFGTTLSSVPVAKLFRITGYMVSPAVDPELLMGCMAIRIEAWVVSLALKFGMWAKGHFWSSSS